AAMRIQRENAADIAADMASQRRAINQIADPDAKKAADKAWQQAMNDLAREAQTRAILRDLYSPFQLQEQMAWFWGNHFSVHARKREIRALLGDYDDALRAHALGRFADLLRASLTAPAMLQYLDNDQNAAGHINENYAREIMELHTLGVGSGYSQKDVQELARILTGVGVRLQGDGPRLAPNLQPLYIRRGLFEFNPARHDFGDKQFMGRTIRGQGFAEVEQALDMLAHAPATARHVSAQIATYMLGQPPSPALVDSMASAWQHSDGRIDAVLQALFASAEYRASLGQGFKDPVHYVLSAVRYAYGDSTGPDSRVILNADPIIGWLSRMGEGLYEHETPDGYPLAAAAWTGPGQMEIRFEIARAIGSGSAGLFRPRSAGSAEQPAFPQLQNALWFAQGPRLASAQTRAVLARATSPQEWNMLYLASPDFMRR
ncbi:MAG TPA: DUF1800 domain-containing protein, partial [Novosphingobium sp.]|nr:DUF1800 domain-containing protein [Novosphingobium sp.]